MWIHPIACLMLLVPTSLVGQDKDHTIQETLRVGRSIIQMRVLDKKGNPVPDLDVRDFKLTNRGQLVTLLSVRWVGTNTEAVQASEGELLEENDEADQAADDAFWNKNPSQEIDGRVVVFFLQKDQSGDRGQDLSRLVVNAKKNLDELEERDYVAVVSFDSSFRLNLDLTRDHEAARDGLNDGVIRSTGLDFGEGRFPSIAANIPRYTADNAHNVEAALILLGESLKSLPGNKTLVFIGHGLGVGHSAMRNTYPLVVQTLQEADTNLYSLDPTTADWHSMASTLKQVAADTGGFYYRANSSPQGAFPKLFRAIAGYYELVFVTPRLARKPPKYKLVVTAEHDEILVASPFNQTTFAE